MKSKTVSNLFITLSLLCLFVILADNCDIFPRLSAFSLLKSKFGDVTGQSGSALHAYFGFSIFLVAAMVFRKQFHSMMPWLIVCGVELFNEFLDMLISISTLGHISWSNSLSDILYTVAMPFTVFVIAKLYHYLNQKKANTVITNGPAAVLSISDNA